MLCIFLDAINLYQDTKTCSIYEIDASITNWLQGSRDRGGKSEKQLKRQLQRSWCHAPTQMTAATKINAYFVIRLFLDINNKWSWSL